MHVFTVSAPLTKLANYQLYLSQNYIMPQQDYTLKLDPAANRVHIDFYSCDHYQMFVARWLL